MVKTALASRWMLAIVALLAFALTLPSIGNGIEIDDHLYRARVLEGWTASRSAQHLFEFADPERPDDVRAAMASGELSWWAAPHLRWRYLRPIAALTHHAEFAALGRGGEAWMHLHSVLWMAALALVVGVLYRRVIGAGWVAGLAALLYAINDGHGFTVGWVSNRCSLMAATFGILALIAHDQWRRDGWRPGAVLGPLALAATVLSSEEGMAVCGLLGAYALVLDLRPRRLVALGPYVGVAVAWFAVHHALGYGVDGTGSYTDPAAHPIVYALQALQRIPILVHSELGPLPADLWEVFFVRQGLAWVMVAAGVAFVAIMVCAFARLVRADRVARFWAVGFLLSLCFVCGPHPTDRHLLVVGVAGSALIARFLAAWIERRQHAELLPRGATVIAVAFIALHLVFAPILLPVRARLPGALSRGVALIDTLVPADAELAQQDLVLVNVPFKYLCNFASVVRRSNGGVSPRRWFCLGVSDGAVEASRPDATTLVLRPAGGYLRYFEDTNVRARQVPFAAGERVELPGLTITVQQVTADQRPAEVAYRFAVPLEDAQLRWRVWRDRAYRPFVPPAVGATAVLPADHFAFGDLMERR
ncbi:MAG TPA: hypothetical protein VF469_16960 [Kofleriaceae bacterium]